MLVKRSCLFGPFVILVGSFRNCFVSAYSIHTALDDIHWIASNLASALENVPPSILVAVQLYITGTNTDIPQKLNESVKESGSDVPDDKSSTSRSYSTILKSPFVEFHQGRPDLKPLISKEIDEATGRISITGNIYYFFHPDGRV